MIKVIKYSRSLKDCIERSLEAVYNDQARERKRLIYLCCE